MEYVGQGATDHQTFLAILECVASFTVGIAVSDNTGIGTGTLITAGNKRAVLTAEHVIRGAEPQQIRFWCKPNAPLVERPAKDVSASELRKLTAGIHFPIETVFVDAKVDLALLILESGFELPTSAECFDLSKSHVLTNPGTTLDGLSLVCFGFPVDNSKLVMTTEDRGFSFLGCTLNVCYYDAKLNADLWDQLPSSMSRDKNFLLKYNRADESIEPPGFSGSGAWISASTEGQVVWNADPLLVGVVHRYFKKFSVLMATNLITIFEFVSDSLVGTSRRS